jgi:hypothetical protein
MKRAEVLQVSAEICRLLKTVRLLLSSERGHAAA